MGANKSRIPALLCLITTLPVCTSLANEPIADSTSASRLAASAPAVTQTTTTSLSRYTNPAELMALASRETVSETEALRIYERVLEVDPDHESAYDRLWDLVERVRLPENRDRQELLKASFPGFELHVSPNFLVLYDTDRVWALNRAVLLEQTYANFYRKFRRLGLRPMPLKERLVCVLFEDHKEFAMYARKVDNMIVPWASGYYSSRTNRIAFFHDRNNPQFKEVNARIEELSKRLPEIGDAIRAAQRARDFDAARRLRKDQTAVRRDLTWHRNRLREVARLANTGKTTHEAVHQLCFNSGLMSRETKHPFWLAEGLATCFETTDPSKSFGPGRRNPSRFETLVESYKADRMIPLYDFVVQMRPHSDDQKIVSTYYGQAWGLFNYLYTRKQDEMRKYLQAIADLPPGTRDDAELRRQFEDAFGPIESVQTLFTAHVRSRR